jgi:glycosyltransferase involved in cell wall biosynthesis
MTGDAVDTPVESSDEGTGAAATSSAVAQSTSTWRKRLGSHERPVDVTVLLPAYNEEDSIQGIHDQIVEVLDATSGTYEILFVDDGSTDATWERIQEVAASDERVRALRHRRNYGKASALANGFSFARGEIVVTSDADMQYDPEDIVRLLEKLCDGWDVVSAEKVVRRDPLSKRVPSKFFNFFVRTTTGVDLHDFNAGLKAYRHDAAEDLIRYGYGELHRFFILLAARRGYSVAEVPVESRYRTTGKSKYGAERYVRGALDYLTVIFLSGYAERPLHLLGGMGLLLCTLGTIGVAAAAWLGLVTYRPLVSIAWLIVSSLAVVTGVQLIAFGLLAEMVHNLEHKAEGRGKISEVLRPARRGPRD